MTTTVMEAHPRTKSNRSPLRLVGRVMLGLLAALLLALVIFVLLPSPIQAVAWTPPTAPELTGVLAPNDALRDGVLIAPETLFRPEDVTFDTEGRLYTGLGDGRIMRITDPAGANPQIETFVDTEGYPLDMRFDGDGNLLVSDWERGLISINPDGEITTLVAIETQIDGVPFRRPDGVAIASDGMIYYGDGSWREGEYNSFYEVLEQRPWGRLLAYDPATGESRVLLPELYFANGVVLAPDEAYVLVADQYRYRIVRYWLQGEQAGSWDYLVENLPGFPHNIHFDEDGILWVALNQGRNALADLLHPYPFLKNQVAKLPGSLFVGSQTRPEDVRGTAMVLALNTDSEILLSLQNQPATWLSVSAAYRSGDSLYMAPLDGSGVLRYDLTAEQLNRLAAATE
ncbi:MAG: SMP-30/gluconolactonase/LRE family protein [bacterium]|nr:SMP-30/gluconolactonase/LRE family protein [bacterium]